MMAKSAPGGSKRWVRQREDIADYVYGENGVFIEEVAEKFEISHQTARRALGELIEQDIIVKGSNKNSDGVIDHRRILYLPTG